MKLDEITLTEILKDVLEQGENTQKVIHNLGTVIEEKNKQIAILIEENRLLIAGFEHKMETLEVKAPQPDLSEVNKTIDRGFIGVNQTIEKGPKSIVRQFRFTLFPEQVRNPEYYSVMLYRMTILIVAVLFLILAYLLINKSLK
jgi:hypothetical protein